MFGIFKQYSLTKLLLRMSDDEGKLDFGSGGSANTEPAVSDVTADETKLIKALREHGIKPKFDSKQDIVKLRQVFADEPATLQSTDLGARPKTQMSVKQEPQAIQRPDNDRADAVTRPEPAPRQGHYSYPKLSVFFGEEGKGEATWESFKFEVETMIANKIFTEEQLLIGIRKAVKGSAGDKIRRLGQGVNVAQIMNKLESAYGCVESR